MRDRRCCTALPRHRTALPYTARHGSTARNCMGESCAVLPVDGKWVGDRKFAAGQAGPFFRGRGRSNPLPPPRRWCGVFRGADGTRESF